jgi:hypothetical protein
MDASKLSAGVGRPTSKSVLDAMKSASRRLGWDELADGIAMPGRVVEQEALHRAHLTIAASFLQIIMTSRSCSAVPQNSDSSRRADWQSGAGLLSVLDVILPFPTSR